MAQWVLIAGDKIAEKQARDEEMGPVMAQVDDLVSMILYGDPGPATGTAEPGPPPTPDDQATAWAQSQAAPGGGFMGFAGPPNGAPSPPPRGPYAHPYAPQQQPQPPVVRGALG